MIFLIKSFYGIGFTSVRNVFKQYKLPLNIGYKQVPPSIKRQVIRFINFRYEVNYEKRKTFRDDIKRIREVYTYKCMRHRSGYPVRGQRTRSNSKTNKSLKFKSGLLIN